jgi:pimeloyl-ACP methyl ester carboxylesterase
MSMKRIFLWVMLLGILVFTGAPGWAETNNPPRKRLSMNWFSHAPAVKHSRQFGTDRIDFELNGCRAMILMPIHPAPGGARPWIFCAPVFVGPHPTRPEVNPNLFNHPIDEGSLVGPQAKLPDHSTHRKLFQRLLENGFTIGGIEVGESMGNPAGCEQYSAYYRYVVKHYGLDAKPCLYATSRGGLMLYNWAADHPEKVRCIGANQPVIDLALFPGLDEAAKAYQMPPDKFRKVYRRHNPQDRLEPLAARKIPILHVVGEADKLLPLQNQLEFQRRYTTLGGPMEVVVKPGIPHGLWPELLEEMRIYDFFMHHAGLAGQGARDKRN